MCSRPLRGFHILIRNSIINVAINGMTVLVPFGAFIFLFNNYMSAMLDYLPFSSPSGLSYSYSIWIQNIEGVWQSSRPLRGFHILIRLIPFIKVETNCVLVPFGAFIFLFDTDKDGKTVDVGFSSPSGLSYSYSINEMFNATENKFSSPSGLSYSYSSLTSEYSIHPTVLVPFGAFIFLFKHCPIENHEYHCSRPLRGFHILILCVRRQKGKGV